MNPLAASFVAKGLLILMTRSSVATGLAHSKLISWTDQMLTRRAVFWHIYIYPSLVYNMIWFVAFERCRQLSLLWKRQKFKYNLRYTDEAQYKVETCIHETRIETR